MSSKLAISPSPDTAVQQLSDRGAGGRGEALESAALVQLQLPSYGRVEFTGQLPTSPAQILLQLLCEVSSLKKRRMTLVTLLRACKTALLQKCCSPKAKAPFRWSDVFFTFSPGVLRTCYRKSSRGALWDSFLVQMCWCARLRREGATSRAKSSKVRPETPTDAEMESKSSFLETPWLPFW